MADMIQLRGLGSIRNRLDRATNEYLRKLTLGLKRAGLFLQRESMQVVPVDTGNLRASAFTMCIGDNTEAVQVQVGYSAAYALYVHENLDARHKAGKTAKFLEAPLRENLDEIKAIVREAVKR